MSDIRTLTPSLLWQWFNQICAIPHPSYFEEPLAQFIVDWAKTKKLFVERDEVGNILIRKPATAGMENRQTIALQAHLDMVPQANADTPHNFQTDPIRPFIDGDWVKAQGTTLGADNGIGLASCLAVLDTDDLAHPELEVLLTMTEEAGMEGAIGLKANWLKANLMVNTDTEEHGEIYIGCAGGENANLKLPLAFEANTFSHSLQVHLKGLQGGHSGCDIHTNRANAIKLSARLLAEFDQQFDVRLAHWQGGSVRNAIPREAGFTLCFNENPEKITACLNTLTQMLKTELAFAEPHLQIEAQAVENPARIFTAQASQSAIRLFNSLPNGVIRHSDIVAETVETSLSIGILQQQEDSLSGVILIRSLVESGKSEVRGKLRSLADLASASVAFSGDYPGWQPDPSSQITPLTKRIYDQILGGEAEIKVIHAGLECGLIKKVYPQMDLVSIGPTIRNAHSPDEKVHIPAVAIYWQLLTQLLANIPAR